MRQIAFKFFKNVLGVTAGPWYFVPQPPRMNLHLPHHIIQPFKGSDTHNFKRVVAPLSDTQYSRCYSLICKC